MALYAISILTAIFLEVVQGKSGRVDRLDHAGPPAVQVVVSPFRGAALAPRDGSLARAEHAGRRNQAAGMVL